MKDTDKILVFKEQTFEHVISVIQKGGVGIALVVDKNNRLISTITDGDVRRAILNKISFDAPISKLIENRPDQYPQPTVMPEGTPSKDLLKIMEEKVFRQIPLLDEKGCVVELALLSELLGEERQLPMRAVIMAGGKGQRLMPFTKDVPKPMLKLKQRPLLERIIKQLSASGVKKIYITTNYKSEVISEYFGNGSSFGVAIRYIHETYPLGTVGALGLIDESKDATLVINGDILTQLNFRHMYDYHKIHKAMMSIGVRIYDIKIPYGVVETKDIRITGLAEKPVQKCIVNAGIYILEPEALKFIPQGKQFDMTQLVDKLLRRRKNIVSFPVQEYWLDIGHIADYERAKVDVENNGI